MALELSPRLWALADWVEPGCRCLADIGTDHGYIPAALLLEGRVQRAVASDIAPAPLDRARATAERWGLTERMDLRLGNGLEVLAPGEADAVVIAGMGGDTLVDILAAAPWCRETALLLQPMSRAEVLRPWLAENGFAIRRERLVQDRGVLYPILDVSGGEMALSESEAWGGVLLGDDPLWGRFLEEQILRLRRAAAGLFRARDSALAERRETFLRIAGALEEKKGEFEYAHSS